MKTCKDCIHHKACTSGVMSTKAHIEDVVADYCPAFDDIERFPIPPCRVGDTLYRTWTCGGRKTIAKFHVTCISMSDKTWDIYYQSAHSKNWITPVVRHCKGTDIGKILFLSEDLCK